MVESSLERKAQCVLVQGEDKNIVISLSLPDGTPYNLTNASDYKVYFRKTDGTALVKTKDSQDVTLVNSGNSLATRLRNPESKLLLVGENQSVEVRVIDNGYESYAQIENALTVKPSLFPNV